jgi:hypothetical protein
VQRNKGQLLKQRLRSTGKLYFRGAAPHRWEYLEPDPSTMIAERSEGPRPELWARRGRRSSDLQHRRHHAHRVRPVAAVVAGRGRTVADSDWYCLGYSTAGTAAAPVLNCWRQKAGSTLAKAFPPRAARRRQIRSAEWAQDGQAFGRRKKTSPSSSSERNVTTTANLF